ncbi:MAG: glycosyltransferase family 1 protein [Acidobacteria bacterium]|nr:glycosyltransferase family 1 protein [Acidobacteriota bacterium]
MNILFVGDSWQGSTARSMREAMAVFPDIRLDDLGEDHYFPVGKSLVVRGTNRLLRPWHRTELEAAILAKIAARRPDCLLVYRGGGVCAEFVRHIRRMGVFTANVFPDYSPHAFGAVLKSSMGEYDLVVSTKPFHPAGWKSIYGYDNPCVCVPHGYDPALHFWPDPPGDPDFDLVLAATWRHQYQVVMQQLAGLCQDLRLKVGIVGSGWRERRDGSEPGWEVAPALTGRAYGEWLRRGRIVIAPVHHDVVIRGVRQPGDEDTIRTYELAAMGCFFLHRRTPYAQTVYDEQTEVPMWDDADELAEVVRHYLPRAGERADMARRAHARAVPAYSIPARARQVIEQIAAARRAWDTGS